MPTDESDDMTPILHLGDCLDVMGGIPDGSVDLIAADLPYGTTACKWDSIIPIEPLWAHYRRILKPLGAVVLTACQPFTSMLVMSNPKWFKYDWAWQKSKATGHLNARIQPLRNKEDVLVFAKGRPTYNPQMTEGKPYKGRAGKPKAGCYGRHEAQRNDNNGLYYPKQVLNFSDVGCGAVHPTQKPVPLFEYLIRTYSNEGETVLDNTMGSGTTGVACVNTGRRFIGIEKDPEFFAIAQRRIAESLGSMPLFAEVRKPKPIAPSQPKWF